MAFNKSIPEPEISADDRLGERIKYVAAGFIYPQTPNLTTWERERLAKGTTPRSARRLRFVPAIAVIFVLILTIFFVSPVRARILDWIRIGAVKIFLTAPSPTEINTPESSVPAVTPTVAASILDLPGETTLVDARSKVGFTILIPTVPADLGAPQHVFLQKYANWVVTLVWMEPSAPDKVRFVLTEARSDDSFLEKFTPKTVQETTVGEQPAVWVKGKYLLVMHGNDMTTTRLIDQGHTLIWTNGDITYRLETSLELDQAIKIAESIP